MDLVKEANSIVEQMNSQEIKRSAKLTFISYLQIIGLDFEIDNELKIEAAIKRLSFDCLCELAAIGVLVSPKKIEITYRLIYMRIKTYRHNLADIKRIVDGCFETLWRKCKVIDLM